MPLQPVYVSGIHTTKFGELWDKDLRELGLEAAYGALEDAKIPLHRIDAIYVANMLGSRFAGQDHLGALFASELGVSCPSYHIEAACASGAAAIRTAWFDILSGNSSNVLVIGVEKMTDVSIPNATTGLSGASDEENEAFYGATFPGLYAMIAREHMNKYGTTPEQLANCAVKNHQNALRNPKAHFRKKINVQTVLKAVRVADPLGLFDCSPISDGAAAVVLSRDKVSKVQLIASGQAQDSLALHERQDITTLEASVKAASIAFLQAQISRQQVDFMEVHDCFTIAEILAYEDLGFVPKGQGGKFIASGASSRDGKIPTNVSGGLKASGHPVGATGVKQVAEVASQLRGEAGEKQLEKTLNYGLTHNVGGSGATCVVNILKRA